MPKIKVPNEPKGLKAVKDISRKLVGGLERNGINGFCVMYVEGLGVSISGNYGGADNFAQLLAEAVACAADEFQISPTILLSRAAYHLSKLNTPSVQNDPLLEALSETFGKLFEGGDG